MYLEKPDSLNLQAPSSAHNHAMRARKRLIRLSHRPAGNLFANVPSATLRLVENLFLGYSAPLAPPNYCPRPTTATQRREGKLETDRVREETRRRSCSEGRRWDKDRRRDLPLFGESCREAREAQIGLNGLPSLARWRHHRIGLHYTGASDVMSVHGI
jgi:hypothetical protein